MKLRRLRYSAVAVSVAFAMFTATGARAGFDIDAAIRSSAAFSDAGDHKQAFDALDKAALYAEESDRPKLHAAKGRAHGRAGDYFNAIIEYGKAARNNGGDSCMFAARARFFESIGEYGQAWADVSLSAARGCESSAALSLQGRLRMIRGDYIRAIRPLVESIEIGPELPDTLADISTAYLASGQPWVAAQYARAASDLKPNEPHLLSLLADALSMSGAYEESIAAYRRALELDPKRDIAANNYGFTLFAAGRTEEAAQVIDALNDRAANAYALCNAVEIRLRQEKHAEAYGYGQACLEQMEKQRGLAHYERYYIRAIIEAMRAIEMDREELHPLTQLDLADQRESKGDLAGALSHCLVAAMLEPSDSVILLRAGKLYAALGDTGRAGSLLESAVRSASPGSEIARDARRVMFNQSLRALPR